MGGEIESVVVVGYGVMGSAVARTFAQSGFRTTIVSRRAHALGPLPGVHQVLERLPAEPPDLVLEFGPENAGVKRAIYVDVDRAYPDADVILATGTSGLDLRELAAGLRRPRNLVGVHYFMPADATKVVEVMAGPDAGPETVDRVARALERTGKEPVRLYRPTIGFLVNRLQHAILHEAYGLIQSGVATAAEIDHAARRLLAPRMCITGLIQQKDISGLAVHGEAQRSIVPDLRHDSTPNPMLQSMLRRGETGLAAGLGFYDWSGRDVAAVRAEGGARLAALMEFLDAQTAKGTEGPRARTAAELLAQGQGGPV